jgi:hypothetical protein
MKDPRCLTGMHTYVPQYSDDGSGWFRERRRFGKATPINSGSATMFGAAEPSGDR